ncbi:MAG: hypothetical protein HY321_11565 [Armatimonadetes bacterium]|nr:hypothetical protein [Armatimonadota bacterium]
MRSELIPIVDCQGSPREMGRQYGEQAREGIRLNVELFTGKAWRSQSWERPAAAIRGLLAREIPDVAEELAGIAEGADISPDRILLMNHLATIGDEWTAECTPLAVGDGPGPIVAKNNDDFAHAPFRWDHAPNFVVRRTRPDRGLPMIQVTYSGWLSGLDAMNAAGVANTHGSVGSVFDRTGPRIDVRLWGYHLMRTCATTRAFLEGMLRGSLTGKGFSIAVGDAAGDTLVVEAALPLIAYRDRGRPFVYSTNLYATEALKNADRRSAAARLVCQYRTGYLRWMEENRPPRTLADVQAVLSSHEPWAPCRHGGSHLSHTEWSLIALPRARRVLVSNGPPCDADYQAFSIEGPGR